MNHQNNPNLISSSGDLNVEGRLKVGGMNILNEINNLKG